MTAPPVALTVAGTDSGGGAGVAADLKTFGAHGVWGTVAVTAVTAQNTLGVQLVHPLPPEVVAAQIESVVSDIGIDSAKTGALASAGIVEVVAAARLPNLVVDPVLVSKHGHALLGADGVAAVRDLLVPRATVITPNLPEAAALVGFEVDTRDEMERAGRVLTELGCQVALVKGGHLVGDESPDCLVTAGGEVVWLEAARIPGRHTHGTGCTLSAAIAAGLARGMDAADACVAGKHFVERAIAAGVALGGGIGPVNPDWERAVGP